MFRHFSLYTFFLFAILSIFIFTACVSDPKTDTVVSTAPVVNTVTVGLRGEPQTLNPIVARTSNDRTVYRHIFNTLLVNDPQQDGAFVPFLAKTQPVIKTVEEGKFKGGKSYTYEIRPEAIWDDGKPVLASDYLFTLKIIFNPHVSKAWKHALSFLKAIELDTDNPRKFTLYSPSCKMKEDEYLATIQIYPEHLYDPAGLLKDIAITDLLDDKKNKTLEENENLIQFGKQFKSPEYLRSVEKVSGSGAYRILSFKTKESVILEKKKGWWGDKLAAKKPIFTANPDKLIYKVISDAETSIAMLKDGELDIRGEFPPINYIDFQENALAKEKINFKTPAVPLTYYMVMNLHQAKLKNKYTRQAIAHLIDMDKYIEQFMPGFGQRTTNPYPRTRPYYHKGLEEPKLDLDKAKALLAKAGWKDSDSDGILDQQIEGTKTALILSIKAPESSVDGKRIGELLQKNGIKVGVQFDLVYKDARTLRKEDLKKDDYDLYMTGIGFTPSKYDDSSLYFHTTGGRNYSHFGNAKTDAILERIVNNCDDNTTRNTDYKEFQEILYDERPCLFLYQMGERIAINKRFDNVVTSSVRPGYFENYFIAKK